MLFSKASDSTERGFFLIDAVVAVFILSIVAAGLIASFATARDASRLARQTAQALVVTKDCIEIEDPISNQSTLKVGGDEYVVKSQVTSINGAMQQEVAYERVCTTVWSFKGAPRGLELKRVVLVD